MTTSPDHTWTSLEGRDRPRLERFDPGTLDDLPLPARRFLAAALPAGTPLLTTVELRMRGRIKLGVWLPFTARQILRAGVGFVWEPVVGGRIVRFVGSDSLGPDGGRMTFRFHDRVTVVDASGPDVHRSAVGRLAAETVAWLPQALTPQAGALWRNVDDERAAVVLPGPTGHVVVEVTVDDQGHLTEILLQRWKDSAKTPAYAPFGGEVTSSFEADGVRIAGSGAVGWERGRPGEDDALFFRYEVTSAKFLPALTTPS